MIFDGHEARAVNFGGTGFATFLFGFFATFDAGVALGGVNRGTTDVATVQGRRTLDGNMIRLAVVLSFSSIHFSSL